MKKDRVIRLRCTQEEYEAWSKIAKAAKVTLSDLIRASIGVGPPYRPRPVGKIEQIVATNAVATEKAVATRQAKHPAKCSCFDCVRARKFNLS